MNHPVLVTGQGSDSHEAGAGVEAGAVIADIEAGADIGPGPNDGAFQAQDSFDFLDFDSNGYHHGLGGFLPFQPSLPVLGGPSSARTSARPHVAIKMVSPKARDERPIKHRRDVQLKLEIFASAEPLPFGVDPPEYCIRVSRTNSVKSSGSLLERTVLDLRLEVLGATTGRSLMFACPKCSLRESPSSPKLSMIDFVSKEDLISVQQGKASIAFRFLCLPGHHGNMDEEYKLSAMILEGAQVIEQHTFPNWIRVISNSPKKKNAPPATIQQGIETSTVMNPPSNSTDQGDISNPRTLGASTSGTSAGEDQRSGRVQSLPSPVQSPPIDVSASVPPANNESEPAGQRGSLQSSAGLVNEHVAEADPELSRVHPERGPTSGGDVIFLIVSNLPPAVKLYARFGCNITPTARVAREVLSCRLPPSAHPGRVNVTLCQAPSRNAEPYGRSLASFVYEANSAKAVSLLLNLFNGQILPEDMPLIQRLLLRNTGSPSLEVEPGPLDSNMSLRSSLPESAFLNILSALQPLPEFPRLLATVNEQGQTLLHLAIHLRYRELVQKLIHWGIDLNARDVNGFTALHVGYLCDDAFVIGFLEGEGATPFVLDELGRSPTELAASISGAHGITTGKNGETDLLAVGNTNRPFEQWRLHDQDIPAETQEIAFGPTAGEGHPSETLFAVDSGDLFHDRNPADTTHAALQAINEQLIRVDPGHAQPLHNQTGEALKPRSSWEMQRDGVGRPRSTLIPPLITTLPERVSEAPGPQEVDRMNQLSSWSDPAFFPCVNPLLQTSDISRPRQPIRSVGDPSSWPNPQVDTMRAKNASKLPNTDFLKALQSSMILQSSISHSQSEHCPSESDPPSINDVESLRKGIIKTSRKNTRAPYTILLVGEAGTGKSSLLEFIANTLIGNDVDRYDFNILDHSNEQGGSSGQSQTKSARSYRLTSKNGVRVRILDTPGLADTRGIDQDELHKWNIANEIQKHIHSVTAVLILADGSAPRLMAGMDNVLSALSALFPKTLANNIAFLFSNHPTYLCLNYSRYIIPNILRDAPQFFLDNPIGLQRKFLESKDDPDKKKGRKEMRKAVKRVEQTALETLVDLFDWLDGLEPQPTTEIMTLYKMSQAIEAKITNTLAQMDSAPAMMEEINKLTKELRKKSDDMDAFSHFESIISALVWKQQPSRTRNYLCTTPNCHSICGVQHSIAGVFLLFPWQFALCSKCNHPHSSHFHLWSTWEQVHETQLSVDDNMKRQWEATRDEKERTDALLATSNSALEDLGRIIDEAMDELARLTEEYARLTLSGDFSAAPEKAILLMELRCKGMEEKGVGLKLLTTVRTSLEHMKVRLDLLRKAKEKARERIEGGVQGRVWRVKTRRRQPPLDSRPPTPRSSSFAMARVASPLDRWGLYSRGDARNEHTSFSQPQQDFGGSSSMSSNASSQRPTLSHLRLEYDGGINYGPGAAAAAAAVVRRTHPRPGHSMDPFSSANEDAFYRSPDQYQQSPSLLLFPLPSSLCPRTGSPQHPQPATAAPQRPATSSAHTILVSPSMSALVPSSAAAMPLSA